MNIRPPYFLIFLCLMNVSFAKGFCLNERLSWHLNYSSGNNEIFRTKGNNGCNSIHININDSTEKLKEKKLHNYIYLGLAHVKDNFMESHYGYYYPEVAFRKYFSKNKFFIGVNLDLRYILFEDGVFAFFSNYYSFIDPLHLECGMAINKKRNLYLYLESAPHSILEPNFPPFDVPVFYLTFLKRFKKNINYSINAGLFVGPDFNDRSVVYSYRGTVYRREEIMYGYSVKFLIGFL